MDNSFFAYMQQQEMVGFFSGYPLLFLLMLYLAGQLSATSRLRKILFSKVPYAYGLVGILFLGFELRKLYPDYSLTNIKSNLEVPWLTLWALLSLLFLIPAIAKKRALSLLHSLVFFFFIVKDLVLHLFSSSVSTDMVRNDMEIYGNSLLINLAAIAAILVASLLAARFQRPPRY
jgi:hypothetical protein